MPKSKQRIFKSVKTKVLYFTFCPEIDLVNTFHRFDLLLVACFFGFQVSVFETLPRKGTFKTYVRSRFPSFASCATPPPPPFFQGEEEVEPPTKFSKGAGLTGSQLLEGIAGKEGGDLFQGGCNFHIKNKLKSQIINDKKSL